MRNKCKGRIALLYMNSLHENCIKFFAEKSDYTVEHFDTLQSFLALDNEYDILFFNFSSLSKDSICKFNPIFKDRIIIDKTRAFVVCDTITSKACHLLLGYGFLGILDSEALFNNLYIILNNSKICFKVAPNIISKILLDSLEKERLLQILFTAKELEVLQFLNLGMSYIEIAEGAKISINTLRMHIKNIYKKMQVTSKHKLKLLFDDELLLLLVLKLLHSERQLKKIKWNKFYVFQNLATANKLTLEELVNQLKINTKKATRLLVEYKYKMNLKVQIEDEISVIKTNIHLLKYKDLSRKH